MSEALLQPWFPETKVEADAFADCVREFEADEAAAAEPVPCLYAEILQDLRHKRDLLDAAIDAMEVLVREHGEIAPDETPYGGRMFLKEAVRKCLAEADKPMSAPDLRDALLDGGYETSCSNLRGQIYNVLLLDDDFTSANAKWSLSAWSGHGGPCTPLDASV